MMIGGVRAGTLTIMTTSERQSSASGLVTVRLFEPGVRIPAGMSNDLMSHSPFRCGLRRSRRHRVALEVRPGSQYLVPFSKTPPSPKP